MTYILKFCKITRLQVMLLLLLFILIRGSQYYQFQIMSLSQDPSLRYEIVRNDDRRLSYIKLINFKAIIAKALPNMDKPHIIRLLFDHRHQSLIAYQDGTIIGGTCFSVFEDEGFAQLAFLAVRAEKRVQGYGKKIMNKTKAVLQDQKMQYIITYGDIMALGFFRKQGFSQKITMPARKWHGYIKQYDGGKLMQCRIHPTVNYLKINDIIAMQKKHVLNLVKGCSTNQVQFDAKQIKETGQLIRKLDDGREQIFRRDPRSIPGVVEAGWKWEQHDTIRNSREEAFQVRSLKLVENITRYPQAKYFLQPVCPKSVPNYLEIIKNPMDFKTISQKIQANSYKDEQQLCTDIDLIFDNCKQFNHSESVYYKSACSLRKLISCEVEAYKLGVISTKSIQK